jgi:catechol 2,3-dioxygenase-like lactoylglutathione lyase family enzyme
MLRRGFLGLILSAAALFGAEPRARVSGVDSIGITVSDLDRAVDFYTRVLTFEKVSEQEFAGSLALLSLVHLQLAQRVAAKQALEELFVHVARSQAPSSQLAKAIHGAVALYRKSFPSHADAFADELARLETRAASRR